MATPGELRVKLWDAINAYAVECGGVAWSIRVDRQKAVVAVEEAIDALVTELALSNLDTGVDVTRDHFAPVIEAARVVCSEGSIPTATATATVPKEALLKLIHAVDALGPRGGE